MRLLILGGTLYLGRHVVAAARARGHGVTLFHRGRTGAELFPDLERLHGDRDGDLGALPGPRWDAAIDTSPTLPRQVEASAALLAPADGHYTVASSISVHPDSAQGALYADDPLTPRAPPP